jgi:beta-N-acetylhexosaminidase
MIRQGINAMMPAHIIFPEIDDKPVGYSSTWLKEILRHQLQFSGLIFSDDLNMQGANIGTKYSDRALAALNAGCDMVLICNNRPAALEILETLSQDIFLVHEKRFATLQGKFSHHSLAELKTTSQWQEQHQFVTNFSTQEIS